MNTDCGHSVRNLKLTRNRAQALRVYPKHLCHGAVRRARSDSRQLLRPLDLLHAGPAAGAFESGGRRRARHVRGHPALLFARTREPRPARAHGRDERAAGRVRGGRDRRAAGQLHAGRRNLEIPRHHRLGGFEYGQPCAEPRRSQPRPRRWRGWRPTARWRAMWSTARSAIRWRCRCSTPRSAPAASWWAPIISVRSTGTAPTLTPWCWTNCRSTPIRSPDKRS